MVRGFKIFGGLIAVVVFAVVGAVIFVYSSLDSIVKDTVEDYGPRFTGVSVTLDKVELSPESGVGLISGLIVGNPSGYQTEAAFKLGTIAMHIDLRSVTSETILIKSIVISGTDVIYEFSDGESNVDIIGRNVEKAADGSKPDEPKKNEGPGKKMVIESLVIINGKVSVSHPLLKGKKLASRLPTIRLKDIGKDKKDGASPAEVVNKIMDALETQVSVAVGATDINNMVMGLTKGAENAANGATDGLKKLFSK